MAFTGKGIITKKKKNVFLASVIPSGLNNK